MATERAKIDENSGKVGLAVAEDATLETRQLRVDPVTGRLLVTIVRVSAYTPYASATQKIDANATKASLVVDDNGAIKPLLVDPATGYLLVDVV